ncbi:uncharacterized protein PGTG_02776 [Puccinia graminis f. sp. tritici CRL 75-36-700-3]|uniref:Uncharacterized protein n=1 Tax=Puccinia graminis f. sp. tritici (strain CRL 75-36-700-3 / race SCCL) TaxID=418459 RepID=E3JWB0_PUCGT|nr:uncharacterized protein PGTG_02776 [Puccinia graminis f. sp. tritici CRL 75-36-700-3]EFP76335.1 hypothetical protein PGTG_02776 [Puccinia graminis f. sp. tritici CRL 75-36-700-3]
MATEVVRESKILLTPDNYALWLLPMKAKLHKAKSLTIVTGEHTCPDPKEDKENTRLYVKLNEDAYAEIVQHHNQEILAYTNISMNFETEAFESVLKKLEDYASQNQLNEVKKAVITPQTTLYTQSSDPKVVCPHCKRGFRACSHCFKSGHTEANCFQKHPDKRAPKSVASTSKQHSAHLTRYTPEDEEYLQQKYPDLHL